ncbi:MAG: alkylhydroperoxidase-related (seleno)protein, partial [Pseudomonadales bacterium]
MKPIDYSDAPYPFRADFAEGHNRYWLRLAAPGHWLTGEQRVEVAKEVRHARNCALCRERKAALSPSFVDGAHDAATQLPEIMVEVIHRVITDSGRLTKKWFDGVIAQGLKAEEYIEIIGTLVHVFATDEFCRGLGIALNELPNPQAGELSYYRPADVSYDDGAWVPLLPRTIDTGPEADLWDGTMYGNVVRALSLAPDDIRSLNDLMGIA